MNDRLVFSQPAHVVAYLLEGLLAGPAAGSRRRKGGEKGLDLSQLLGSGEVRRQNLRHAAQVAIAQSKPENNVNRLLCSAFHRVHFKFISWPLCRI
jgi:hypothetical protein